ncbi:MAG: hypothetical protein ACTSSI_18305 [Candidatus Helarchaeota archaeon]
MRKEFCNILTEDIEDNAIRNEQFIRCIDEPLTFLEKNRVEILEILKKFGKTPRPDIEKLLECKRTGKIINLVAEKVEGKKICYDINYKKGIKTAFNDLQCLEKKDIEIMDNEEKNRKFLLVESCLPTESYIIEQEKEKPDGHTIMRKLKSILYPEPEDFKTYIVPHATIVTHEFKAKPGKQGTEDEHLKIPKKQRFESSLARGYFDKLKEKRLIKKRLN